MTGVVLASGSPRRRALLEALGIAVEVRVSQSEEISEGLPVAVVEENARRKAVAVASGFSGEALVIGADTIVVHGGRILGKPVDLEEARHMLGELSGHTHEVYTGLHVIATGSGDSVSGHERTAVTFRELDEGEIERFVEAVRPLDRAGAYTVDGPGSLLVSRYEGCYQNVLGLPMARLDHLFRELGESLFERIDGAGARFL